MVEKIYGLLFIPVIDVLAGGGYIFCAHGFHILQIFHRCIHNSCQHFINCTSGFSSERQINQSHWSLLCECIYQLTYSFVSYVLSNNLCDRVIITSEFHDENPHNDGDNSYLTFRDKAVSILC